MKIRFCEHNKGKGKLFRQLKEEFPDFDIKIKSCIKQCGSCREKPTVTVNKQKFSASDVDKLYLKIVEFIKST